MKSLLLILVALPLAAIIGTAAATPARNKQLAEVYAVCNDAHHVNDSYSEYQCGQYQDRYQAEFLCVNTSPNSICWVEDKR